MRWTRSGNKCHWSGHKGCGSCRPIHPNEIEKPPFIVRTALVWIPLLFIVGFIGSIILFGRP